MKNLKKVLAFVIAFTMMLGFAASASVFPDVDDNASYAEAVTILSSLKIMIGDDKGNFNPDNTITRAEVAAIVVRAKGLEDAASGAKGATAFSDVAANHWATGYINIAAQSGIIAGFPDGTFKPEDPVTYEQVTKMIVAALGYTPKAETLGGYPTGYLVIASQEGISKGALGQAGDPAKRSIVARLIFNALEVNVMEQTDWTPGAPGYSVIEGKTLLTHFLKVDKYEGTVVGTYLTDGTKDDDFIKIKALYINGKKQANNLGEVDSITEFAEGDTNAASLFGQYVVAYGAENDETGELTLYAIAPKAGKNKSITLDYSQIEQVDKNASNEITKISYYEKATSTNLTPLKIASRAKYYWNGREDAAKAKAFLDNLTKAGKVTLISYDGSGDEYQIILVTEYTKDYAVKEINKNNQKVFAKDGTGIPLNLDDEEVIVRFYNADGTVASFDDIQPDDVLTLAKSSDDTLIQVYISRNIIEGSVQEERDDIAKGIRYYTIGGKEYQKGDNVASIRVGEEGKFYLNIDNRIVYKESVLASSDNYGFLYAAAVDKGLGDAAIQIKFLNSAGEWIIANLASTVNVVETDATKAEDGYVVSESKATDLKTKALQIGDPNNYFLNVAAGRQTGELNLGTEFNRQLFQYKMVDGKIKSLYLIKNNKKDVDDAFSLDAVANDQVYKALDNKLGSIWMSETTKVFSVPQDPNDPSVDEEDFLVTTVKSVFKDGNIYTAQAYDMIDGYPTVVVVNSAEVGIAPETNVMVITRVTSATNADGSTVSKFYGYQAGVEVMGETSDSIKSEDIVDRDGKEYKRSIVAGDVIIFNTDAKGKIDKIQVLMTKEDAKAKTGFAKETELDAAATLDVFGFVKSLKNNRIELEGTGLADPTFTIVRSNYKINIYEVTRLNSNTAVRVIDTSDIYPDESTQGKEGHYAYVRVYDDMVVDVVVYSVIN